MSLQPGTTLGQHSVTAKIGEGGMGEVYRARDTKLDRDVALKVLPEGFTQEPDRLARFEREANVLARALVLELVEEPTLADRIKRGPIASRATLDTDQSDKSSEHAHGRPKEAISCTRWSHRPSICRMTAGSALQLDGGIGP